MNPDASPTRGMPFASVVGEWAALLAISFVVPLVIAQAPSGVQRFVPALWVVVIGLVCLRPFARSDPVGFASVVGPALLIALGAAFLPPLAGALSLAAVSLLLAFMLAGRWFWPWWWFNVLRRTRRGSPERTVLDEASRLRRLAFSGPPDESDADWRRRWIVLKSGVEELERAQTPDTVAAINGLRSMLAVLSGGSQEQMDRVLRRLSEELADLWRPRRQPYIPRPPSPTTMARPTRGTQLEYEYPRLEALLAAGTTDEQRAMGAQSALMALEASGELDPTLEAIAHRATDGTAVAADIDTVNERVAAWALSHPEPTAADVRMRWALEALLCAVLPLSWPLDTADAVYWAVRSLPEDRRSEVEAILAQALGPERAARATPVPLRQAPRPRREEVPNFLVALSAMRGGMAVLAAAGLAAGVLAKVSAELAWPRVAELFDYKTAVIVERFVVIGAIALIILLTTWRPRRTMSPLDAVVAVLVAFAAWVLTGWIAAALSGALSSLLPGTWESWRTGYTAVLPYAPIYGLATALLLLITALLARRITQSAS